MKFKYCNFFKKILTPGMSSSVSRHVQGVSKLWKKKKKKKEEPRSHVGCVSEACRSEFMSDMNSWPSGKCPCFLAYTKVPLGAYNVVQITSAFLSHLISWLSTNSETTNKEIQWSKKKKTCYLCIDSWGIPQSTVRIPTPEASIGPIVEPHPISFLTTNSCTKRARHTLYFSSSTTKLRVQFCTLLQQSS